MKALPCAAALVVTACATAGGGPASDAHWAELPVLGGVQAALLYHERTHTAVPEADLVAAWTGACGEKDPVARGVAEAGARAALEQARREVAASARWVLPIRQAMAGYDRQRGGFLTPVKAGAVVRFDRLGFCRPEIAYAVALRNGADFQLLEVPEERALEFVRASPSREVIHDLEVEVAGAQPGPPIPAVVVRIVRMRTRDAARGTVLAEVSAPGR